MSVLQCRQLYRADDICEISGEHIVTSHALLDRKTLAEGGNQPRQLSVFEAASGCLSASLATTASPAGRASSQRTLLSRHHWVQYDILNGTYVCGSRGSYRSSGGAVEGGLVRLQLPPPPSSSVAAACCSRAQDGLFFFAHAGARTIHVLLVAGGGDGGASTLRACLSVPLQLDFRGSGFTDPPLGRVVSVQCHPQRPLVFVAFSGGSVQVWSYALVLQFLKAKQQRAEGGGEGGGGGGGEQWEKDPTEQAEGPKDEEEEEEGEDEEGRPGADDSSVTSRSINTLSRRKSRRLAGAKEQARMLVALASFVLPTPRQLSALDPAFANLQLQPSAFRLDEHGRFAGVVWGELLLCVYDVYALLALPPSAFQQSERVLPLGIFGAFPCKPVAGEPATVGAGAGAAAGAPVVYSLGTFCFHSTAPALLVTVQRHRRVSKLMLGGASSAAALQEQQQSAGSFSMPMSPLVYVVSLQTHQPILSCLGAHEVGADLDISGIQSATFSINWRPRSLDCTPQSGLLVLVLTCAVAGAGAAGLAGSVDAAGGDGAGAAMSAAGAGGGGDGIGGDGDGGAAARVAASAASAEEGTEATAAEAAAALPASGGASESSAQASNVVATNVRRKQFALVYSLGELWMRSVGLVPSLLPLLSQLCVPPDAFSHGEGVLSSAARYECAAQKQGGAFAVVEADTRGADEATDQFPLLLGVRTAAERSASADLKSSSELPVHYHVFRIHWALPYSGSALPSTGTATSGGDGSGPQTTSHVGSVPALLTTTVLAAAALNSAAWLQLPAEDAFSLAFDCWEPSNPRAGTGVAERAQALHAAASFSFYPSHLVTQEVLGLSSLQSRLTRMRGQEQERIPGWEALLVGVVRRAVPSSALGGVGSSAGANRNSADNGRGCICFLRGVGGDRGSLAWGYANYRDAAFWIPLDPVGTGAGAVGVLALSQSGRQVVHILPVEDTAGANAFLQAPAPVSAVQLRVVARWDLGTEMEAVCTAPAGAPQKVLFASAGSWQDPLQPQTLYLTPPRPSAADFASVGAGGSAGPGGASLVLLPGERLLQALWQTLPSALGGRQHQPLLQPIDAQRLRDLQSGWVTTGGAPLLGLRTSLRVLLCDAELRVLSQTQHSARPHKGASASGAGPEALARALLELTRSGTASDSNGTETGRLPCGSLAPPVLDPVQSIAWAGAALCCSGESGAVSFLLPGPTASRTAGGGGGGSGRGNVLSGALPLSVFRSLGLRPPPQHSQRGRHAQERTLTRRGGAGTASALLCCLPRNISTSLPRSLRLLAVLPDRLLVCYLRREPRFYQTSCLPQLAFTQRPLNPAEPLALGLAALLLRDSRPSAQAPARGLPTAMPRAGPALPSPSALMASRRDTLEALALYYLPAGEGADGAGAAEGGAGGAVPCAQSSRRLFLSLACAAAQEQEQGGQGAVVAGTSSAVLAAVVSGVTSDQPRVESLASSCGRMGTMRWIPPGARFVAALGAGLPLLAAMVQLGARARVELQELLLDAEAYGGSALPHPGQAEALRLAATAVLLIQHGQGQAGAQELAGRLLDVAGSYASLSALLITTEQGGDAGRRLALQEALPSDQRGFSLLANLAAAAGRDLGVGRKEHMRLLLGSTVGLQNVGGSQRMSSLSTDAVAALPLTPSSSMPQQVQASERLTAWCARHAAHKARTGGQLAPPLSASKSAAATQAASADGRAGGLALSVMGPRAAGLLALDLLEDFMGVNASLELSSAVPDLFDGGGLEGSLSQGAGSAAGGAKGGGAGAAADGMYMGRPLPAGWVEGVGLGSKEHEFVGGYWRFSDAAYYGEPEFQCCSLLPLPARLTFPDLSGFEGPGLELYCASPLALSAEVSSSNVDPGEKHENVKSLCDVVYCAMPAEEPQQQVRGMRVNVRRGSSLDAGLLHEELARCQLTVEMSVLFDAAAADPSVLSAPHVLMQRRLGGQGSEDGQEPQGGEQEQTLWTLWVDTEGAVCFSFSAASAQREGVLRSAPGVVSLSRDVGRAREDAGPPDGWVHIALLLDARTAAASLRDGLGQDELRSTAVKVVLAVRGEQSSAELVPAPVAAALLAENGALLVGPDLCAGWRLTELRLWNCLRGSSELEDAREAFLALAVKRKRLQLRVKGTKKLFSAFRPVMVDSAQQCSRLHLPSSAGGDDKEEPSLPAGGGKVLGKLGGARPTSLAGPGLLGKPAGLSAPTAASRLSVRKGVLGASPQAVGTAASALAPVAEVAAEDVASPAKPMSARDRRLGLLKAGPTSAAPVEAKPAAPAMPSAPAPVAPPAPPIAAFPAKAPVIAVAASSSVVIFRPQAVSAAAVGGRGWVRQLGRLEEDAPASEAAETYRQVAKLLAHPCYWVSVPSAVECTFLPDGDTQPASLPQGALSGARSVLFSPQLTRVAKGKVAVFLGDQVNIYQSFGAAELVAQLALATTKLVYWAFIAQELLLVVTSTSAFTLRLSAPAPTPGAAEVSGAAAVLKPKPVKIFDRVDVKKDVADSWKAIEVTDSQTWADGWVMLTSRTSGADNSADGDLGRTTVSLYHAKSAGKGVSFVAAGGCFRAGTQQVLLAAKEGGADGDGGWRICAIELSAILKYWASEQPQSQLPLSLSDLLSPAVASSTAPLAVAWQLQFSSARSEPVREYVAGACLAGACVRMVGSCGSLLAVDLKGAGKHLATSGASAQEGYEEAGAAVLTEDANGAKEQAPIATLLALSSAGAARPVVQSVHLWSMGGSVFLLMRDGWMHHCSAAGVVEGAEIAAVHHGRLQVFPRVVL